LKINLSDGTTSDYFLQKRTQTLVVPQCGDTQILKNCAQFCCKVPNNVRANLNFFLLEMFYDLFKKAKLFLL